MTSISFEDPTPTTTTSETLRELVLLTDVPPPPPPAQACKRANRHQDANVRKPRAPSPQPHTNGQSEEDMVPPPPVPPRIPIAQSLSGYPGKPVLQPRCVLETRRGTFPPGNHLTAPLIDELRGTRSLSQESASIGPRSVPERMFPDTCNCKDVSALQDEQVVTTSSMSNRISEEPTHWPLPQAPERTHWPLHIAVTGGRRTETQRTRSPLPDRLERLTNERTHWPLPEWSEWWRTERTPWPLSDGPETHLDVPSWPSVTRLESGGSWPRRSNDYVDCPKRVVISSTTSPVDEISTVASQISDVSSLDVQTRQPSFHGRIESSPEPFTVAVASTKAKDVDDSKSSRCKQSIICARCSRCRCAHCTERVELPRRWIVGDRCECSAAVAVDWMSCMCCVRSVFYNCCATEDRDWSDDPCSCAVSKADCCGRWVALGALSLCLPCLCLYVPLRGALKLCTACYDRRKNRGCRCGRGDWGTVPQSPSSKGLLLVDSEPSSSS